MLEGGGTQQRAPPVPVSGRRHRPLPPPGRNLTTTSVSTRVWRRTQTPARRKRLRPRKRWTRRKRNWLNFNVRARRNVSCVSGFACSQLFQAAGGQSAIGISRPIPRKQIRLDEMRQQLGSVNQARSRTVIV